MKCTACSAENEPGRKFCGECGSPLQAACPSCGAANSPGVKFCGECGSALADDASTPVARAAPAAERKLVSVLFADLVGFTSLSEQRDSEDTRELLSRYFEICRRLIELDGGTVEKFIGDAVMAVFGAPAAHDDDPERAVRAGLAILTSAAELRDHDPSFELQVRVGITTGEVVARLDSRGSQGEAMVAGDVVNSAARLQASAPVGAILVDPNTYQATRRAIRYERAEPVRAKGKRHPISVWQAIQARSLVGDRAFVLVNPSRSGTA